MSDNNSSATVGCCRERIHHRSVHWPVCYHHQPGSATGHPLWTVCSKGRGPVWGEVPAGWEFVAHRCTVQVARLQMGESQDRALKLPQVKQVSDCTAQFTVCLTVEKIEGLLCFPYMANIPCLIRLICDRDLGDVAEGVRRPSSAT